MTKEDKNKCPLYAQFSVPWAGKILKCCIYHANAMAKIAQAIGGPIQIEHFTGDEKCSGNNDLEEMGVELK